MLARAKSFARLRDAEVDGMTPIEMHFDPILADCAVGLDVGKIRERRFVHALTDGLDLFHNLADVSSGRENKRAPRFDSTASKNG